VRHEWRDDVEQQVPEDVSHVSPFDSKTLAISAAYVTAVATRDRNQPSTEFATVFLNDVPRNKVTSSGTAVTIAVLGRCIHR
jgi:hypothetical protein